MTASRATMHDATVEGGSGTTGSDQRRRDAITEWLERQSIRAIIAGLRDSNRLPEGEDSRSEAECAASQSGDAEGGASPTLKSTPTRTAK